jgi:hypothetical protein
MNRSGHRSQWSAVATTATVAAALLVQGNGFASAATEAPAVDGAASGGAVIVVLKDQHSASTLRAQGAARTATTRADQSSIVSAIKAGGGTDITQLVSVNAVAARLPAAEVARLQADPAVAQIVPDATLSEPAQPVTPQEPPARLSPKLCPSNPARPLLNLTTSGKEFTQTVDGSAGYGSPSA